MSQMLLETIQWSTLPHINTVPPLNADDYAVLSEIREVLQRRGYTDRFGVCLLHRHFDLAADECLMEYTDEVSRTQTLVVEKRAPGANRIETSWRFGDSEDVTVCEKVCDADENGSHSVSHPKLKV